MRVPPGGQPPGEGAAQETAQGLTQRGGPEATGPDAALSTQRPVEALVPTTATAASCLDWAFIRFPCTQDLLEELLRRKYAEKDFLKVKK